MRAVRTISIGLGTLAAFVAALGLVGVYILQRVPMAHARTADPLTSVALDELPIQLTRTAQIRPTGQVKSLDLVARRAPWELLPGVTTQAVTYNGTVPGPTIRVTEGDTLRVTLKNELDQATSIHWHGLHVPNAMDGVPGVTQPAIQPGETFTYEFTASHAGTFIYHPHVNSVEQIDSGLYGLLVIDPQTPDPTRFDREFSMVLGAWQLPSATTSPDMPDMGAMPAMDGAEPEHRQLMQGLVAAGPSDPRVQRMAEAMGTTPEQALAMMQGMLAMGSLGGQQTMPGMAMPGMAMPGMAMPGMAASAPARPATTGSAMSMDYNYFTINGKAYPAVEPWSVQTGDLVRVRIVNISNVVHPMHLHGQDFKVIAKDGEPLRPELQQTMNTLTVNPGETYDIAFLANNPGSWVFHCHDLHHAENDGQEPGGLIQVLQVGEGPTPGATAPAAPAARPAPAAPTGPTPAAGMPGMPTMPGMGH